MFTLKARLFCSALLIAAFTAAEPARALAAEDIYYLENEIRETQAKHGVIQRDLKRIDDFLSGYPGMTDSLAKAYKELDELEARMRSLLQKNLIKSTIKLGFDTYGKVNLVLGFANQSIKMIVLACACEAASDAMQDSFSSPYTKTVKGLSEEARKLAPEIEEVQKTLSMDAIDLKIKVMRGGEDPEDLGETGLIYRKFYYVLEAIEKAKKKIYELRKVLDKTKADLEGERPAVAEEEGRLGKRLEELKKRLDTAHREATSARESEIRSQVNSKAAISISAVPIPVKDEQERQTLISKYQDQLWNVVADSSKRFEELESGLREEAVALFPGQDYDPLRDRSDAHPLPQPLPERQIAGMGPQELKQEVQFYKFQIDFNKKLKAIVDRYPPKYEALESSYSSEAAPLMSALAGLGGDYKSSGAEALSRRIVDRAVGLKLLGDRFPKEDDIYRENVTRMEAAFKSLVDRASACSARIVSPASNVIEAGSFAIAKARAALQAAEAAGFKSPGEAERQAARLRAAVAQLYADGASGAQIRELLEKEKKRYADLHEASANIEHLKMLAVNTRAAFEEELRSDPDYALMQIMIKDYPEEGVKDTEAPYREQLWDVDVTANPKVREGLFENCAAIASWSFANADEIREFLTWVPKIDDVNQKVRALFAGGDYEDASRKMAEAMSALNADRPALDRWLKSYASVDGGKTPGVYRVLSTETQAVIQAAEKRMREKQEAEARAKRDEEAKRLEEERARREREEAEQTGYRLTNVRVNTLAVPNQPGEMVLVASDLREGAVTLSGMLTNTYGVRTILVSEDGSLFQEIPAGYDLSYTFVPMPDKRYEPIVKLRMESGEDKVLPFFDSGQALVYRNIDHSRMVAEAVKAVADAYESMSVARFSELISRDFLGNRTFLEEGARFDFDLFMDIRLQIYIDRIERRGGLYICETKWNKTQMVRKTGQQQRTEGRTTFIFVLEDGRMKIQNLRGNLIYATLSPEIAESSGLSQAVVEQVKTAQIERSGEQPGAGGTQESGTSSSGGALSARSGQVHSTSIPVWEPFGFDLAGGSEVAQGTGDFNFETNQIFLTGTTKVKNVTAQFTFENLTEAPADDGSYLTSADNPIAVAAGQVYAVITGEGYYGKISITDLTGADPFYMDFRYAVQTDHTRNVRTS